MRNRVKEEERIERVIRGLLKLPENRRCINCNSLGPQYICTTFWTFVCTNCSGIHREFTHRVKSISMAKFSAEEVNALQAGGNERARQIYFKEWDPQRCSFPDTSNLHKLRDFIKHVYVDRKYTGSRDTDKLPIRLKVGEKEDFRENKNGGSERNSCSGRNHDDKSLRYYYDERRSPRYAHENTRHGGFKRSPIRFEIVDDRVRDGRRSAGRRCSAADQSKLGSSSSDLQNSMDGLNSPVVRPVGDILGANVPRLQVGEFRKATDERDDDCTEQTQAASSKDPESINTDPAKHKRENSGSLIDFNTDAAAVPETQQNPPSKDGGNGKWASSESSEKDKASQPSNTNTLESLLFQLSVPAAVQVAIPTSGDAPSRTPLENFLALPSAGSPPAAPPSAVGGPSNALTNTVAAPPSIECDHAAPAPVDMVPPLPNGTGDSSHVKVADEQKSSGIPQQLQSASPAAHSNSSSQHNISTVPLLDNQPWTSSLASNTQGPAQDSSSGLGSQACLEETKFSGRKELPEDLFTASYSSVPTHVFGWQTVPTQGMGMGPHYHPAMMPVPSYPNSAKSTNPFDLNDYPSQVQAQQFPLKVSLQGARPYASVHTGLMHSSGAKSPGLMLPHSPSRAPALPPESSFVSAISQSGCMGQQFPNMRPARQQGLGGLGCPGNLGSFNTNQQPVSLYSALTTPKSSSSVGGNPFG